jgi:hypothetical protein
MRRLFDDNRYHDAENDLDYMDYPNDYPTYIASIDAPYMPPVDQPALPGFDALVQEARDLGGEVTVVTVAGAPERWACNGWYVMTLVLAVLLALAMLTTVM